MERRLLIDIRVYSENKNAIKKPFKALGLKWRSLGQTGDVMKGQYARDGCRVFVQYGPEHADFTLSGDDAEAIDAIVDAWADLPFEEIGEDTPAPEDPAVTQAVSLWEFRRPTRREGEPDRFYERRLAEWEAEDPRKA